MLLLLFILSVSILAIRNAVLLRRLLFNNLP